jgi:hypothetical protein
MKVSVRRVEKLRGRSASRTGLDTLEPTAGLPALEPDRSVLEASRVVYSVVPGRKVPAGLPPREPDKRALALRAWRGWYWLAGQTKATPPPAAARKA